MDIEFNIYIEAPNYYSHDLANYLTINFDIAGATIIPSVGIYKNESNPSFIIRFIDKAERRGDVYEIVRKMRDDFDQESVLVTETELVARLV